MSHASYTVSKSNPSDVCESLGVEFVIETGGKAMQRRRANGGTEFLAYQTRQQAEAELGAIWDTFPTAGVYQRAEEHIS